MSKGTVQDDSEQVTDSAQEDSAGEQEDSCADLTYEEGVESGGTQNDGEDSGNEWNRCLAVNLAKRSMRLRRRMGRPGLRSAFAYRPKTTKVPSIRLLHLKHNILSAILN